MARKTFWIVLSTVLLCLFAIPIFLQSNTSICTINRANAQESPCEAQEATITALETENASLQATIEALTTTTLHIVLKIDADLDTYTDAQVEETISVIERRLNELGLSSATVQSVGNTRIAIDITAMSPNASDQVLGAITEISLLEFVDFSGLSFTEASELTGQTITTTEQIARGLDNNGRLSPITGEPFETILTGDAFSTAVAYYEENYGQWLIQFEIAPEFQDTLADYTSANIGNMMAITLDGEVLSAPTIQTTISDGAIISGNFDEEEAKTLALQLRSGALALPVSIESVELPTTP